MASAEKLAEVTQEFIARTGADTGALIPISFSMVYEHDEAAFDVDISPSELLAKTSRSTLKINICLFHPRTMKAWNLELRNLMISGPAAVRTVRQMDDNDRAAAVNFMVAAMLGKNSG